MAMMRIKYGKIRKYDNKKRILTIGNFDGVHRGHQEVLKYCVKRAEKLSLTSSVLTFCPHPKNFFKANPRQECLQTLRDKSREIFS